MAGRPLPAKRYTCGGGHNGCAIDPNGHLTICVLSHQDGYDLRSGSFRRGWEGRLQEIRALPTTRETICTNCQIRSLCSMCPANGELENGDAESPVAFLCQVAHLRAYTLGVAVPEHGDCACCPGGADHIELLNSAARLKKGTAEFKKIVPAQRSNSLLPVLQTESGCGSGGCTSCRTPPR